MKIYQTTIFASGLLFLAFNSYGQSIPFLTNGLVAYWPLNGNANDVWGTNNGMIQGATLTTDRFGNSNSALYFDGTDRVIVQDSPSLDLTNAITVAAWFNSVNWNGNNRIVQKSDLQYQFCAQFGFFNLSLGGVSNSGLNAPLPSTGVWHHSVATYDGATMSIYIDGILAAQQSSTGYVDSTNDSNGLGNNNFLLNIGAKPDSVNPIDFFTGSINDVAIYNRALSSNEVSELYQSFATGIIAVPTVTISGTTNEIYSIQYVTNLSSTNWITLLSNIVLKSNYYLYPDTNSVGQPYRFYRVLSQ